MSTLSKEGTQTEVELFRGRARLLTQEGENLPNSGIEALSISSTALTMAFLYIDLSSAAEEGGGSKWQWDK